MPTRRALKSVAHNLVDSMLSGPYHTQTQDILQVMTQRLRHTQAEELRINLLEASVTPTELSTETLEQVAVYARDRLTEVTTSVGLSIENVSTAEWRMTRPPASQSDQVRWPSTVVLVDDLGHHYEFHCPLPTWTWWA